MNEWPRVPLGDLCDPTRGIRYGIVKVGRFVTDGVPVIRGGDIRDNRIAPNDHKRVSEQVNHRFRRTILAGGEIVINLIAEPGRTAIVPPELAGSNVSRDVAVIPLGNSVSHAFVNYYLQSSACIDWLRGRLQGSVTSKINLSTLRTLPVPLPPLAEQRRIADVLQTVDDRLALGRAMNRTLEEMARIRFQAYFTERRELQSHDSSPCRAASSSWRPGRLGDIAINHRIAVQPTALDPLTPCIGLADMPRRAIALARWGAAGDATSGKSRFNRGDLLFGKLRPAFKKVGIAPVDGVCSSDILVLRPTETRYYGVVLGVLTDDRFLDFAATVATGTRMPRISWKAMADYPICIPPDDVAARYTQLVVDMRERLICNIEQSRTLSVLRKVLLSELLSGRLSPASGASP